MLTALLEAKDEVDPGVQVLRHVVPLQRLPHDAHKLVGCMSWGGGVWGVCVGG